jgi:hypothetical protein
MRRQLFSRFRRLWLGVFGTFALIICGIGVYGRQHTAYACLEFNDMLNNHGVLDLTTGNAVGLHPDKLDSIPDYATGVTSHNRNFFAYAVNSSTYGTFSLWIKPIARLGNRPATLVRDNLALPIDYGIRFD